MKFRTDIQALRGLAVTLVVLFHAQLGVPGGYLGVDVFFVVSGFLITGILRDGMQAGTFRFREFYSRRIKRLLPASYVAFVMTAVLAGWLLTSQEMLQFGQQLIGALSFTGNIVLWRQSGYFDGASEFKPLLHVWSLSLEEQYYVVLPLALRWLPTKAWPWIISLATLASLGLCLVVVTSKPSNAFFWLPTRAWELGIGSTLALIPRGSLQRVAAVRWALLPALAALLAIPIHPLAMLHPGANAIIVCCATAIVLAQPADRKPLSKVTTLISAGFAKIGDASYSIYLIHWPLFAFLQNAYSGQPGLAPRLIVVGVSLALAWLLYHFVENPTRSRPFSLTWRSAVAIALVSLAIAAIPQLVIRSSATAHFSLLRAPNVGFAVACDSATAFAPSAACQSQGTPHVLVWGDSMAMHLVPGLRAVVPDGVVQATRSNCGPFIHVAPLDNGKLTRKWAKACAGFSQSVLDYARSTPAITTVVLASTFEKYANHDAHVLRQQQDGWENAAGGPQQAAADLAQTVQQLIAMGKRVVVVAPPARADFDVGLCLEREARGKLNLRATGCTISVASKNSIQANVSAALQALAAMKLGADVQFVDLAEPLCDANQCQTSVEATPLYRDDRHFSVPGAELLAQRQHWNQWFKLPTTATPPTPQ